MKALVTGNGHGIGLAITKELRKSNIEVPDISEEFGYDLMSQFGINRLFKEYKEFDIIICNLGGMGTCRQEDYEECMKKNFFVNLKIILNYLPNMIMNKKGRVIFISSVYGKEKGHNPVFTAAKAAQIGYIKSKAGKYKGITFNAVCPGFIKTKEDIKKWAEKFNAPLGKPEDIAHLVSFLVSDKANFIDGAVITCDGGFSHSF